MSEYQRLEIERLTAEHARLLERDEKQTEIIARLREELRDYLLSDEAAEGNGYGCYSAGMREKLWALVGREGR